MNNVDHGLSPRQLDTIKAILSNFAEQIARVELFGSRATGRYRPNSDVDLVVTGSVSGQDIDRIRTLFQESNLPISVDVLKYDDALPEALRLHIDEVRALLLTQDDLRCVHSTSG